MAEKIDGSGNAQINNIRFSQQVSHPSSPSSGYEVLYIVSGSAHGGLYVKDSAGRQIGPFITGTASAGGGRTLLATETPSGVGTVTFSSISSDYKDLEIEVVGRSTQAAGAVLLGVQLNGDTTAANYRRTWVNAYATSTITAGGADSFNVGAIAGANAPANSPGSMYIKLRGYKDTTFNKTVWAETVIREDSSSAHVNFFAASMEWENAAAVTQVVLVLSAGNWVAGSEIRLYGLP